MAYRAFPFSRKEEFPYVQESLPDLIVEGQTLAVDAIAGATVTSTAILTAVADCVTQAGGDAAAMLGASDVAEVPFLAAEEALW